jgi:hypothetical protein
LILSGILVSLKLNWLFIPFTVLRLLNGYNNGWSWFIVDKLKNATWSAPNNYIPTILLHAIPTARIP